MAKRDEFSVEEILEIEKTRSANKDKRAEARLKALEPRAKEATGKEVSERTVDLYAKKCGFVRKENP